MWKVVGFKRREKDGKIYFDLSLQREYKDGTGVECRVCNYSAGYINYVPALGDMVMISMGSYNGRSYVQEVLKVR